MTNTIIESEKITGVPFVNFKRQYQQLKSELDAVWEGIMSNGDFIMRKHLEDFEREIADYIGVKHAIGVNSGTDALYISAHALGWKPGDEIITVGHTFVATIGAIAQCGATPVLVDVAKDYNIDVTKVEAAITSKTKGIIPVHLNGRAADMGKIMELAKKHNLKVIEDAAQALGSKFNGKHTGSFGDTSIFSFYPAKMLGTAGDGGIVCTNDDALAFKLRALRDNGRVDDVKVINCYGYCTRLDNLHAALLSAKFKHFDDWVSRRREIAQKYDDAFKDIADLGIMPAPSDSPNFDVYQNYVVRTKRRDEFTAYLKSNNIGYLISWIVPNHLQKPLKLDHFDLPETVAISNEVVSLPMYPEMTDEEVDYVIDKVKVFFK
ncbi:DegT/DnrJ/EryC1/StrS family aminotransferase [Candidatus Woesearchaeota archaeon]|nr:DegT/DnrJ/EryC1/StrS family aminotransferase [Candidatus Woesearchaeota archaeon]